MPVDTRNERAASLGVGLHALRVWPHPDGSVDQADRQHLAVSYPGILASGAVQSSTRASMVLLDLPVGRPLPFPDGTMTQGDRQQLAGKYRGILASGEAPAAGVAMYIPQWRRRRR